MKKKSISPQEFAIKMEEIKNQGFIKTHRKGPTSVGKTLEDLLGIKENCIAGPDIGKVELKSARIGSNSMLTLNTKSPDVRGANSILRDKYGYKTKESIALNPNVNILHTTINGVNFNTLQGKEAFKIIFEDNLMKLIHKDDGETNVYWSTQKIKDAFKKKFPLEQLFYVKAKSEFREGVEYFHYVEAYHLKHFSAEKLLQHIKDGIIDIDIRIGLYTSGKKKGKSHDHGTAIRIRPDKLDLCFDSIERIV